jgi:hypothetical protein
LRAAHSESPVKMVAGLSSSSSFGWRRAERRLGLVSVRDRRAAERELERRLQDRLAARHRQNLPAWSNSFDAPFCTT